MFFTIEFFGVKFGIGRHAIGFTPEPVGNLICLLNAERVSFRQSTGWLKQFYKIPYIDIGNRLLVQHCANEQPPLIPLLPGRLERLLGRYALLVVVQIDGMGTAKRSKAFHDVSWKNIKDAGFPDRILWHRAVAARYPYYDISQVGMELVHTIVVMFENYGIETEVLAASLRSPMHVVDCALAGADVCTMFFDVMKQLYDHPLTDQGVEMFLDEARLAALSLLLAGCGGPEGTADGAETLAEAERLVESGVRELLVVSQDTSAYGVDLHYRTDFWHGRPLATRLNTLAKELGQLPAWTRLHYVYPYPHVDDLLPLMADGLILPYLDMPLQHGSQRILKAMRRPAATEKVLSRIARWRDLCPDLLLRSTFIVGFPGETEQDFDQLLAFIQEAQLDRVGCFPYSPVEGAAALSGSSGAWLGKMPISPTTPGTTTTMPWPAATTTETTTGCPATPTTRTTTTPGTTTRRTTMTRPATPVRTSPS